MLWLLIFVLLYHSFSSTDCKKKNHENGSTDLPEATQAKLRAEHAGLDPFELKKTIEAKLKKFFTALGNLDRAATKT